MQENLVQLASGTSAAKKQQLADHVGGMLAARSTGDTKEAALLNDVLVGVYDSLDAEARQKLSHKLADADAVSARMAMTIAKDDIEIAQPVLERSRALRDADVLSIAESHGQEHMLALSKRDHLDAASTSMLVKRGGKPVRHAVAANLGADISPEDFERLVEEMPKQLGEKIRHLRKSNEELIQDLFREDNDVAAGPDLEKRESKISPKAWVAGIKLGKTSLNKACYQLAIEHNLFDVVTLLAFFSGLQRKYVQKLMVRFDATGIASVCRSVDLGSSEFKAICKERCKHLKFPESTGNKWLTNYHMLDGSDARQLVGLMRLKLHTHSEAEAA